MLFLQQGRAFHLRSTIQRKNQLQKNDITSLCHIVKIEVIGDI